MQYELTRGAAAPGGAAVADADQAVAGTFLGGLARAHRPPA